MTKFLQKKIEEVTENLMTFLVIRMENGKGLVMNKETHQLYYVFYWTGSWRDRQLVPLFKTYEEKFYGELPPKDLEELR